MNAIDIPDGADFLQIATRESWMQDALCAQTDPALFHPEKGSPNRPAKRICARCPVREACLAYALARDEYGVWGGMSQHERQVIQGRRPYV